MWEINQNFITIFNKVLAVIVLQEYARVANNTKKGASVAAYQGLENY